MTLKEFIETTKESEYIITDRVRVPVNKDNIKYLETEEILVTSTEFKKGILYVYTDYIADSC